jgi:hypothetical protein
MDVFSALAKSEITKQAINELVPTIISTVKEAAPMFINSMIQKNNQNNQNNNYLNNQIPQQLLQQNNTPQVSEEEVLQKRKLKAFERYLNKYPHLSEKKRILDNAHKELAEELEELFNNEENGYNPILENKINVLEEKLNQSNERFNLLMDFVEKNNIQVQSIENNSNLINEVANEKIDIPENLEIEMIDIPDNLQVMEEPALVENSLVDENIINSEETTKNNIILDAETNINSPPLNLLEKNKKSNKKKRR